ncbi:uncharacterized protein BDZ99DRAFT_370568, partial [Mytilinidion resinicola]
HLPFNFGVELELIIRPKHIDSLPFDLRLPDSDATPRQTRDFNFTLLKMIAQLLSASEMPCNVFDHNCDEEPDYTKWNATLDASISKAHIANGFYPVEIVTPIIKADADWVYTIDKFWSVMDDAFLYRRDISCGTHVHISPASGSYNAFEVIETSERDQIVDFVSPDKYVSWNFRSAKTTGFGSIEFRRPPGVTTTWQTKHWVAFTMAFTEMAIQASPEQFDPPSSQNIDRFPQPTFDTLLMNAAYGIRVNMEIDQALGLYDDARSLHIANITDENLEWLWRADWEYMPN